MKKTSLFAALVLMATVLAACEPFWESRAALKKPCSAPPAKMRNVPAIPGKFPIPLGMSIVAVQHDGPATIVSGWIAKKIGPAHEAFAASVKGAAGYSVTKEEQDALDAEVNFSGKGNSGQVKLVQECVSRSTVRITIRPA